MKVENLVRTLDQMTDDELREHLRQIRHNREVARPVAHRKAARTEAKETRKKQTSIEKMLNALSPDERAALMNQLEGVENGRAAGGEGS